MITPSRTRLKKRDVTLNPLSEEWFRRKATPFGVRFLEGKQVDRIDYTKKVFENKNISLRVHPLALASATFPVRKLFEQRRTSAHLPFAEKKGVRSDIMKAQLKKAETDDKSLAGSIL